MTIQEKKIMQVMIMERLPASSHTRQVPAPAT